MNDKRDMAPMVWGYIKSRETARRMGSYAGEVTGMHPQFAYDSAARAYDLDLATTKEYAGPNHISAGIQHGEFAKPPILSSSKLTRCFIRFLVAASPTRKVGRTISSQFQPGSSS